MADGGAQGPATENHSRNHDVPAIRHVGLNRIVDHIKRAFWWRGMWSTVGEYVRTCPVCQLVKSDHRKKAGALQPIPLLERKWQQITTDLVMDLQESEGKTAIAVFVDRLSKMVHFAPCTNEISAEKCAQLFIDHVFKHHGLPEVIISTKIQGSPVALEGIVPEARNRS